MKFWTLLAVLAIACLLPIFTKKSDNDKVTADSICENELGQCMVKEDNHQCMLPLAKLDCPDGMQCCKTIIPKDYEAAGLPLKGLSCKNHKKCTKKGGKCISSNQDCEGTKNKKLCPKGGCTCCYVSTDDKIIKMLEKLSSEIAEMAENNSGTDDIITNLNKQLKNLSSEMAENNRDIHRLFYCALNYQMVYKDSCYFTSSNKETWSNAQEICVEMGGNLVKIDNDEEFSFLQGHVTKFAWIGLSDTNTENIFIWVADGSSLSTGSPWWIPGEPNDHKGREDCVLYWPSGERSYPYKLVDKQCTANFRYICEMPIHNN